MSISTFFDVLFPDNEPLGLIIEKHKLTYTVSGRTQTIDCCAVVSSFTSTEVNEGDVLININEFPLLNNPSLMNSGRDHFEIISKMINEARPPRRIRFLRREMLDGSEPILADTTVVSLRPEEAALLYDEVQEREHEEKVRIREREKQLAIEREKQRVEEEERRQSEIMERKRREEMEKNIIKQRERHEYEVQERQFYEEHPANANLYEISFPTDQHSLGLSVIARKLTYIKESRKRKTIDCCVVTQSELTSQVKPGDIIVKINDMPLVSDRAKLTVDGEEQAIYFSRVMQHLKDAPSPRTLMLLRPILTASFPGADLGTPGLSDQLLICLSRSEENTMFESPMDRNERQARESSSGPQTRSRSESGASTMSLASQKGYPPMYHPSSTPSYSPMPPLPPPLSSYENTPPRNGSRYGATSTPSVVDSMMMGNVPYNVSSPITGGTYLTEEEEIAKKAEERIMQMKVSMGVQSASSAGIALSSMSSSMGHMSPLPVLSEEEEIQRRVAEEVSKRFEEELRLLEHGRNRRLSAETTSVETSEEEIRRIADEMVKKRLDEELRKVAEEEERRRREFEREQYMKQQMEEEVARRVEQEARRIEEQKKREYELLLEHKVAAVQEKIQELELQQTQGYTENIRRLEEQSKAKELERLILLEKERRRNEEEAEWMHKQQALSQAFESANTRSPASGRVFKIMFPDPGSTGLRLIPHTILYTDAKGRAMSIDCVMVTESKLTQQIQPGDILVSINSAPLTQLRRNPMDDYSAVYFDKVVQTINGAIVPRNLIYFRAMDGPKRAGAMSTNLVLADALLLFSVSGLPQQVTAYD